MAHLAALEAHPCLLASLVCHLLHTEPTGFVCLDALQDCTQGKRRASVSGQHMEWSTCESMVSCIEQNNS